MKPPVTGMVTLTINDGHGTDTLNFIFNVTGENPTLYGTADKDILYGTTEGAKISLCSRRLPAPATTSLSILLPDKMTSRWITAR